MKLRALRVHGFKSFADPTDIDFHEGITAIVGPNGCGKSNISDAIRWVLGEQRPTAIRGARMEEAIFQGTVNRRPVNRGSVVMTVSNEDGALPVPFEEVEIGRTVYRDGGSDYSLNRSACRLKDVVDLCRDTGLGANAYSIIENRMIDAILSDRADERRSLFEEAAGIGKYKDRRKSASRRLERAEADLQRLEDLIGEVQSKVRSLARQKGKAERWQDLRRRRLSVEMAVLRHEMGALEDRLSEVVRQLESGTASGEGVAAELRTAEAEYETLRIRRLEVEKARAEAASRLDGIRRRLVRWERDLAVADEKAAHAERRLAQIARERAEARERVGRLTGDVAGLRDAEAELDARVATVAEEQALGREEAEGVRGRLRQAREELEEVETREREVARRGAQLEGDADAAEAQATELERRLERLVTDLESTASALSEMDTQGDLFSDRLSALRADLEAAGRAALEAEEAVESARKELDAARNADMEAADRASSLEAERSALERMERDQEGVEPVVRAALARKDPDVLGSLADFVRAAPERVGAVEAYLGPAARGLVVQDEAAAERLRRWFVDEWGGGGGLVVLRLDRVPGGPEGDLLEGVEAVGPGAPWVRALLSGLTWAREDRLLSAEGGQRLSPSGAWVDRRGVLHIGNPGGATGVLERRERLDALREAAGSARERADAARADREAAAGRVRERETALDEARRRRREAEDGLRKAEAELAAQGDRRARMDRQRDELARQVEGTRAARARSLERGRQARDDRRGLLGEERALRERRQEARERLEAVQEEWEAARAEENRLTVDRTRLEAERSRVRDRAADLERDRTETAARVAALGEEEEQLRDERTDAARVRIEGETATEALFAERDEAETVLAERDAELTDVSERMQETERKLRAARNAEREAADRRHRLELERQELEGRQERIRERLEGEWGRSFEALLEEAEPLEGEPGELREELREIVAGLERIGAVNMLAVEEHAEESARLAFLEEQRADLVSARDDLRAAIRQINQTATELFQGTFEAIRENFRSTFQRLFQGGEADLWLEEADDPLESTVEIHASPRGKKTQRIDLLSGGERALTALSLLFGIYLVKPSPFCVLDEVDAPLDESNIGRFIRLLQEFKDDTQFVIITHNPRTIEAADWIYGVTMEEPGVSTIVGVRLEEALQASGSAA